MDFLNPSDKLVPQEAFRYWPRDEAIYFGHGRDIVRFVFYRVTFTDFEQTQIQQLKTYLRKHAPALVLPEYFCEAELLRQLLACHFDLKKTFKSLTRAIAWREKWLGNGYSTLYEQCQFLLNSGAVYFQGIDHKFRPLLVLNLARMDFRRFPTSDYSALLCFTLEFLIKHMMLPGQIENWAVITDLGNVSLFKLPTGELKPLIKTLQENYKCRMIVNYVLNAPRSISIMWRIVKGLIDEKTARKIKIEHKGTCPSIFSHFAPNQIEEKYGGTAPNRTEFWPIRPAALPYHRDSESPETFLSNNSSFAEYFPEASRSHVEAGAEVIEEVAKEEDTPHLQANNEKNSHRISNRDSIRNSRGFSMSSGWDGSIANEFDTEHSANSYISSYGNPMTEDVLDLFSAHSARIIDSNSELSSPYLVPTKSVVQIRDFDYDRKPAEPTEFMEPPQKKKPLCRRLCMCFK